MAEYIEREALLADIDAAMENAGMGYVVGQTLKRYVKRVPAADVAPVRHGWWKTNSDRPDSLICSVCKCGFDMWKHDPHNYCPNCGAKMDGGKV